MAETDMKAISEFALYNRLLDQNSLIGMTVNPSGSNVTRKVYFSALKTQIEGYEIIGTLTAGSTSITLSSAGSTYNDQTTYSIGDRVTYTDSDEVTRNYICIHACTAANWETNSRYFVEYTPINSNSDIRISTTKLGVNPTDSSIANNAITLTFPEQNADIGVKVRVRYGLV